MGELCETYDGRMMKKKIYDFHVNIDWFWLGKSRGNHGKFP
jgi:hypothetical protein